MHIHNPNYLLELVARTHYLLRRSLTKTALPANIEYRHHRWYRFDGEARLVRVSRTYYDVMQPCQGETSTPIPVRRRV